MNKKRYQDYVIKDGKFVGEFENMYKDHEDPWIQSDLDYINNSASRRMTSIYLNKFKIKTVVEFGCGLGHTSKFIESNTNTKVIGVDISETAISKAKKQYEDIDFRVDNITNIENYSEYDAIFFSEITWYLLEDKMIDKAFEVMKNNFKGKYFIHNLVFYKGQQQYGLNYFKNLEEFIKFAPFEMICKSEINCIENETSETSTIFKIV